MGKKTTIQMIRKTFLSKMNRDVYTRRCFEIPAMKKLLLCERSEDMQEMFVEDKEAVFFSDKLELLEKVKWLLANPTIINDIAEAGFQRVSFIELSFGVVSVHYGYKAL